jgi:hypothetical protein
MIIASHKPNSNETGMDQISGAKGGQPHIIVDDNSSSSRNNLKNIPNPLFKNSIIINSHHAPKHYGGLSTSSKVRHCSIEEADFEKLKTEAIFHMEAATVSPPPSVKSNVRVLTYSHLPSDGSNTENISSKNNNNIISIKDSTRPVMLSIDACVEHQSFNDLLGGVLGHPLLLSYIKAGWIPTSVFLKEADPPPASGLRYFCFYLYAKKSLISAHDNNISSVPERIDSDATYRKKLFSPGRILIGEVRLEHNTSELSTESFDLYIFVRDLLIELGITSNLRYFSSPPSDPN